MENDEILRSISDKVDDLCDRQTRMETKWDDYLDNLKEQKDKTNRNIKIGFSVLGTIFSGYAIIKEFLI